jgi:uncharacterized protein
MLRILLIALVFAVFIAFLFRRQSAGKANNSENSKLTASRIVKCTICDVHVAEEDALEVKGQFFCCVEHRQNLDKGSQQ